MPVFGKKKIGRGFLFEKEIFRYVSYVTDTSELKKIIFLVYIIFCPNIKFNSARMYLKIARFFFNPMFPRVICWSKLLKDYEMPDDGRFFISPLLIVLFKLVHF